MQEIDTWHHHAAGKPPAPARRRRRRGAAAGHWGRHLQSSWKMAVATWLPGKSPTNGRFDGNIIKLDCGFSIATFDYQMANPKIIYKPVFERVNHLQMA
jgi:hypothetical protein